MCIFFSFQVLTFQLISISECFCRLFQLSAIHPQEYIIPLYSTQGVTISYGVVNQNDPIIFEHYITKCNGLKISPALGVNFVLLFKELKSTLKEQSLQPTFMSEFLKKQ